MNSKLLDLAAEIIAFATCDGVDGDVGLIRAQFADICDDEGLTADEIDALVGICEAEGLIALAVRQ